MGQVWRGLGNMAHYINGPCRLPQAALPTLLNETPPIYFENLNRHLARSSEIICEKLGSCEKLVPVRPLGGTSLLLILNEKFLNEQFSGDAENFVAKLITEQSVFVHPGAPLNCKEGVRLNLCHDHDEIAEACDRIMKFFD